MLYFSFIILVFITIDVYAGTLEKLCIETSLAGSKRTPLLAGKLQSPLRAGWQYVSFRILNYAGWLTPALHDGWLGVLFPETLACWQWRAGIFFPAELNINEDWRRNVLLVVTTLYEQFSKKWSLGTPVSWLT